MDWYQTIFELIDMRSFSNLWYWIALAVLWSSVSHWVMGVPWDMVQRARRHGGQASEDLAAMVGVNIRRIFYIMDTGGALMAAAGSALVTGLAILGWGYAIEFAQAVFLLVFPMILVGALTVRTAGRIRDEGLSGEALYRALNRYRFWVQLIGVVAIFITAVWGMYTNMAVGPF